MEPLVSIITPAYNVEKLGKYYFKNIKAEDCVYWLEMIKNQKKLFE